jgi:hypothetical protein
MQLLEDNILRCLLEIFKRVTAIVDADSDGNVIVLNCSSGAPDSLPLPCNMAAFEFPPIVYFFLSNTRVPSQWFNDSADAMH